MKRTVFFVMVAMMSLLCLAGYGLQSDVKAATNGDTSTLDGEWSITEKFCVNTATGQTCDTSAFDITISDGTVSTENEEVGSVALEGKKVSFEYTTDYLSSKFEELFKQAGYDVTIESLTTKKYAGKLKNNRMSGRIKGSVDAYFSLFQRTVTYDYSGTFKGKKQQ